MAVVTGAAVAPIGVLSHAKGVSAQSAVVIMLLLLRLLLHHEARNPAQEPWHVLRQDLGIALTGCSTNRHSRVSERTRLSSFDFRHDNRVAATLQQCWPCALLAEHFMATVSFVKLVTSLMGGVGCLGMGSVAVGHKALGISELPERPNQQKREVRASGHKIVVHRYPLSGRQHRYRPHTRTVS